MRAMRTLLLPCLLSVLLAGCSETNSDQKEKAPNSGEKEKEPMTEPEHITVDHILIGVKGGRMPIERTPEQAKVIADDVVARLNAGEDWDKLKQEFSDDPPQKGGPRGGPYSLANEGVVATPPKEFKRSGMVPGFGNVGFKLAVGDFGVAPFDATTSEFGFHIIKRVE
jgi:hypothetical protein